jgi:hypothetical protein
VLVRKHVVVAVELGKVGVSHDEEIASVVFVAADFLNHSELHGLNLLLPFS